ncbi:hypothetical protein B0H11DRAFT_2062977 [Mycena galericulata]|nr:hypothetical protein B0H11DRAFT_2062977 [Mycena galericulata]
MSSKEHISAWYWAHIIRHRAVITRWTAHYQAFRWLQQVQSALTAVIEQEMRASLLCFHRVYCITRGA